jgi:hypothetical protein
MKCLRYLSLTVLTLAILSAGAWSQTSKTSKKKQTTAPAEPAVTAAEVQAMKDAIANLQQQVQQLSQQLQQNQQASQQAQAAATTASTKADAAQADAAQQQQTVVALKSDVSDLKTNVTNTALTLQDTQKNVKDAMESPLALHYKGITITPGGFLAAETVRRSRALGADINTPFNSITMPGSSQSEMSEFFGSGRQSRVSMLAEGKLSMVTLSGYVEADFLSAGITSNNNQSNSYTLRQRQAFGQAAFDNGWSFTGGQMWSLLTETKQGLSNRSEATPLTIDAQYQVGFSWARQYGIRLTKNFGNKVWFGVSMENAQATLTAHNNAANFLLGSAGAGGGLYNSGVTTCSTNSTTLVTTCTPAASYSFNPAPDLIAKLAFEPGFGHYEVFGVYSRFTDRVFPCEENYASAGCGSLTAPSAIFAFNSSKNGGGLGANARWTIAKHIDFGLHGFGGSGVGRYGSGGLSDTTVNGDGTLHLLRNLQGVASLEWHGPKLDVYFYTGSEYAGRSVSFDPVSGKLVGYGSTSFSNSGCGTETVPLAGNGFAPGSLSSCTSDTRALIEGTGGFWYRFYNGPKGRFQFGAQYSYAMRNAWSGADSIEPHGIDDMVFTSFRYYLP